MAVFKIQTLVNYNEVKRVMNKVYIFPAIFFLLLCCSCRRAGRQTEIIRHHERLLYALASNDTTSLRQEQLYLVDTLSSDSLLASLQMRDYLYAWVNSYCFCKGTTEASATLGSIVTEQIAADTKRLAVRLFDTGKEKQLEEMLRIVVGRLLELGMNDAAAVTAAAVMGIDVDPTCPGDIARRLLTRLLLAGRKAPRLSHTVSLVASGPTLLLFYETDCPNCEAVLRDLCGFYTTLKDRGVRVLSIASDEDEHIFSSRAASLPWTEKWYDSLSFYSPDFENYGVASTPTLVVVNPDGRVAGSYHTLEETGLISIP